MLTSGLSSSLRGDQHLPVGRLPKRLQIKACFADSDNVLRPLPAGPPVCHKSESDSAVTLSVVLKAPVFKTSFVILNSSGAALHG